MDIALISLLSLFLAIGLSQISHLNVGVVSLCLAWIVGVYLGGLSIREIMSGFPVNLMMILFGITLLFGQAQLNGTLDHLSGVAMGIARGHAALLPIIFFVLALAIATLGPGNIAAVALLAPVAMASAGRAGVSAFLMTIMVATGANAGAFSPFAPTGIVANGLIDKQGLVMDPWSQIYLPSLLAQSSIALIGYLGFGGIKLWLNDHASQQPSAEVLPRKSFNRAQIATMIAIAALVIGVTIFKFDIGFFAMCLGVLIAVIGGTNQEEAIQTIPWSTIFMVCGVSVLVGVLEQTGGMDLFTTILARISTRENVTGMLAFVTGAISVYSSSSGVVMPAFIPAVPGLIEKLGGGDPVALVSAINVGSHVVDVSPLSTLGALCIANAAEHEDRDILFRNLFIWGLAMSLVGAIVCYLFFGVLWR
ncbi:MAG: SLC13 family permease [Roseiflexaceae bacterium]